jgi:hypothetical protein
MTKSKIVVFVSLISSEVQPQQASVQSGFGIFLDPFFWFSEHHGQFSDGVRIG